MFFFKQASLKAEISPAFIQRQSLCPQGFNLAYIGRASSLSGPLLSASRNAFDQE